MPKAVPLGTRLPVLIWGEGGCSANGIAFANMLTQFASHSFMVIASGAPRGSGTTTSKMMTEAIDWITTKAGAGVYAAVDPTRIAAAGQSCGGLEAYDMNANDKVSYLGIFNSGLLQNYTAISTIKKPVFYFLGGNSDIAYQNVSVLMQHRRLLQYSVLGLITFLRENEITGTYPRAFRHGRETSR